MQTQEEHMTDDSQKALLTSLSKVANFLEKTSASLQVLSLMKLAEEFYTKDERKDFYARQAALIQEYIEAHKELKAAAPNKYTEAIDKSRAARERLADFEQTHSLLAKLYRLKATSPDKSHQYVETN